MKYDFCKSKDKNGLGYLLSQFDSDSQYPQNMWPQEHTFMDQENAQTQKH